MRELEDVALAFDSACRKAGVGYALMGGIAVVAWGQPRMTMDVDALVRLVEGKSSALASACREQGLEVSAEDLDDAMLEGSHATAFDSKSSFHVDLKIARTTEEIAEVESAVAIPFGKGELRIVRAEDTIAFKLKFGSDQDLADARSIIARREGKLDLAHLRRLAQRIGVSQRLQDMMDEIERARPKS